MRIAIVGGGVVGLAVTYELATAGREVDCYEAEKPMAGRSRGDTRVFRLAHDRAPLVDWARQAHRGWQEWSLAAGIRLVGDQATVVSGDFAAIEASMAQAGAPFAIVDAVPSLPAADVTGPFLVDVTGGVIQAAATGGFLTGKVCDRIVPEAVVGVHVHRNSAVVVTTTGRRSYDSVVLAAGAATAGLVAPLGIEVPTRLAHHARMTFRLRDAEQRPPCWLDRTQAWRPGFTSYGQLVAPGLWAVGGQLPDEDTAWDLGRDLATERARHALTSYVSEYLTGCAPDVVDTVYCNVTVGLGDGLSCARVGPVFAVWGENLFKLAPVIGRTLAEAAVELSSPSVLSAVAHGRPTRVTNRPGPVIGPSV